MQKSAKVQYPRGRVRLAKAQSWKNWTILRERMAGDHQRSSAQLLLASGGMYSRNGSSPLGGWSSSFKRDNGVNGTVIGEESTEPSSIFQVATTISFAERYDAETSPSELGSPETKGLFSAILKMVYRYLTCSRVTFSSMMKRSQMMR